VLFFARNNPYSPLYYIPALGNGSSSGGVGNATVIPPNPRLEDSVEALHMMADNPTILLAIFTNMCVLQPQSRWRCSQKALTFFAQDIDRLF
jgi:hypothetical protein